MWFVVVEKSWFSFFPLKTLIICSAAPAEAFNEPLFVLGLFVNAIL
jgi:hypothetical protein